MLGRRVDGRNDGLDVDLGLGWVTLLVAIVLGTVWLVRRGGASTDRVDSPEEILRRRFAAGEIDEDEYFRLQAGLRE